MYVKFALIFIYVIILIPIAMYPVVLVLNMVFCFESVVDFFAKFWKLGSEPGLFAKCLITHTVALILNFIYMT